MAASTVYASRASLEMVGLVQTKTSVLTRASSSVIQMLNVSTRLAPTVVSASRVTMETERHVSIWTNVRWVLIRVMQTHSASILMDPSRALAMLATREMEWHVPIKTSV